MNWFNSRRDRVETKVSELEDRSIENTQTEVPTEAQWEKLIEIKRSHIHLIIVPEKEKRENREAILKNMIKIFQIERTLIIDLRSSENS